MKEHFPEADTVKVCLYIPDVVLTFICAVCRCGSPEWAEISDHSL